MKKLFTTLLVFGILAAGSQVKAQKTTGDSNGVRFGIGIEGALPLGALKVYDAGAGLSLRLSKGFGEGFAGTLTVGGMAFFPTSTLTANSKASIFVPIKIGGRYMFSENFYGMAEAGITITNTYGVTGFTGTTPNYGFISGSSFTYAPSVGAKFGAFDIGVRYEGLDGGGFAGLRLGFDF
ncbi:MAG: hypothetical protein EOO43_11140 [Flavobacterium sp.]|nr:MAG: hypothetical protein EOO43_11140 [Flavobacterium sp.]